MRRHLGTFLLVIGLGVLAWAATVYFWKDPFTTAYTAYEQRRLASKLDEQFASYEPLRTPVVAHPGKPKPNAGTARQRKARGEALPPRERRRRRDRTAQDPTARTQCGGRERHRGQRPSARTRPPPRVLHAGGARTRLHRGAPNDVRSALREHQRAPAGRPDHRRAAVRDRSFTRSRATASSTTTTSPCSSRRITRSSSCRRVIQGSSRASAISCTRDRSR